MHPCSPNGYLAFVDTPILKILQTQSELLLAADFDGLMCLSLIEENFGPKNVKAWFNGQNLWHQRNIQLNTLVAVGVDFYLCPSLGHKWTHATGLYTRLNPNLLAGIRSLEDVYPFGSALFLERLLNPGEADPERLAALLGPDGFDACVREPANGAAWLHWLGLTVRDLVLARDIQERKFGRIFKKPIVESRFDINLNLALKDTLQMTQRLQAKSGLSVVGESLLEKNWATTQFQPLRIVIEKEKRPVLSSARRSMGTKNGWVPIISDQRLTRHVWSVCLGRICSEASNT